jgi:hypothetical protein
MTMVLGPARRKSSEKSKTPKTTSSVEAEVQPAGDEDAKE